MQQENGISIVSVRERPQLLDEAVDFFSRKWPIPRIVYADSLSHSLDTKSALPRWYLLRKSDCTIGGFGLIPNDFSSRGDLWPWLCALYVEEKERGRGLGGLLLAHGRSEAARLGFERLYLSTDHVGYYEKYGWEHIGNGYGYDGEPSRIYGIRCSTRETAAAGTPLVLETARLLLRPHEMADLDAVQSFAGSYANLQYTIWGPNTEEQTKGFLLRAIDGLHAVPRRDFQFAVVLRSTGRLIGGCGLTVADRADEAEIGWVLDLDVHRQGFGTELGRELLRFGFEDLGMHRIFATCRADNYGSYRVMERNGMRREGLFRQNRPGRPCDPEKWYDEFHYAMLAQEWKERKAKGGST